MDNCIFCKIVKGATPSTKVTETESMMVIQNIDPKAPTHWLIIPKDHLVDTRHVNDELWLEIRSTALSLMDEYKHSGVRLVANIGDAAAVKHMHMHYMAGVDANKHV